MTQVAKAMERLRPWLPLREDAAFSGAFDAIYSGAHADIVTLWQDAAFRGQKQDLDGEGGAQPEDTQRRFFDPLYEKARELEAEKAQLEAALAREKRKTKALSEKVEEGRSDLDAARENAEHYQAMFDATERERDEWKARAEKSERSDRAANHLIIGAQDEMMRQKARAEAAEARAEAAEARTAPAVTKRELRSVVGAHDPGDDELAVSRVTAFTDRLWALVSGDDPAVYVVRESDIAAVEVERHEGGGMETPMLLAHRNESPSVIRNPATTYLQSLAEGEALARAIEAEQAKDPVEEKARELAKAGGIDFDEQEPEGVEMLIGMARHVLREEKP